MNKKGVWLSVILAFALLVSGCGGDPAAESDDGKLLKVGTDAAYPPFEKQEGNGEISGFDIDIIKAIAKAGGFKIDVQHTGWDPLFEGIERGKLDAGISAITITDERKKKFDFSEPYFEAKQLILVPQDSDVESLKDLKGKQIGVQSGTTGEIAVQKAFGKTYDGIRGYDDTPAAIEDLVNGRVDAVVADNGVVLEYMKKRLKGKFKTIEDPAFEPEEYGIMVKKGNQEVLDKFNKGLETIKQDGTYDEIYKKYFGQQ